MHYGFDGWQGVGERVALPGPFGLWIVSFTAAELESNTEINFTRRFDAGWEGIDHRVTLGHAEVVHALTHRDA